VEAIRQLQVARAGAVQVRTAALNQLGDLVITTPAAVRASLTAKTQSGMAAQAARWRPDPAKLTDPAHAARLALHSIAGRVQALAAEITALERQLSTLVNRAAPT
jgi:transposase